MEISKKELIEIVNTEIEMVKKNRGLTAREKQLKIIELNQLIKDQD